ncbi:hypothetical protein ACFL49_00115 [Candidatus Omnitrophota bacterium]
MSYLDEDIHKMMSKKEAGKEGDGNVAFKCNWNDRNYMAPCSEEACEFNINEGRARCNILDRKCLEYPKEVTLDNCPCYESIALKEMYFAAGWDQSKVKEQPRHIHSVRLNKMAILTTRPPGFEEKDRLIIACLFIERVEDDPGQETEIYGDKTKSLIIDYDKVKIRFWDYYKNAEAQDLILWASGLFRYVTDEAVLNILNGICEKYANEGMDTKKVIDLIRCYEEVIKNIK